MEPPPPKVRPALKLKMKTQGGPDATNSLSQPTTPSSQTPMRTPSIKLSFGKKATGTASIPATPKEDGATPNGSAKKRKRTDSVVDTEHKPETKRPMFKLLTKSHPITTKSLAPTPGIKLKTKGKIPRRPQGVGYDSEMEDREQDPVLLEGLVIRMQPGPDCDYIRDSIANGTVGVSVLQNGADIRLRFLDVNGRRGVLYVKKTQYAFTVVDLPTITEGMKSWDKKNFIKSIDISQLLLVLGPCSSDEEARNYPLPTDINPKNYKYAHGLTAPMRNVRKRRFERTARARLDDIEAIERKVNQILETDDRASEVKYEVLDYDPRQEEDEEDYSDSESDAEGEVDDGYFPHQGEYADTSMAEHTAEDLADLEDLLADDAEDVMDTGTTTTQPATDVNSSAPSPMPMEDAPTPIADADADGDDDADDDDEDENAEASDQEASDEKEEMLAKIKEAEDKISQQRQLLKKTTNAILRKKIAQKVQALESDVKMMKRHAGIRDNNADGDGDEGGNASAVVREQEDSGSEEE